MANCARVDFSEPLPEHIGEDLGRIEQESLPRPSRITSEALPPPLIAFCRRCLIQQDARNPQSYSRPPISAAIRRRMQLCSSRPFPCMKRLSSTC